MAGIEIEGDGMANGANRDIALMPGTMMPFDLQDEIDSAVELVRGNTMVTLVRLATTYQIAAYCDDAGIAGSFVECGVWKGGVSGLMAIANLRHGGQPRQIHLFDSFVDMCEPDESVDGARAIEEARRMADTTSPLTGSLVAMEGFYSQMGGPGTVGECQALFSEIGYPAEHVSIHEGWFQDTMPSIVPDIGPVAILRLDSDYYASTRYCLGQLFDLVVPGGFVIIDDYGCYEGCRKAVDEFLAHRSVSYFLHHADSECRYIQKPTNLPERRVPGRSRLPWRQRR